MQYSAATEASLDAWVGLRLMLWGGTRSTLETEARDILDSESDACFLATTDSDKTIGFIEISIRSATFHTYAYIEGWYVAPAHRRQGIGTSLLDHAEQWLLHSAVEAIFSDTDQNIYPDSIAAHAHSGYEPVRHFTLLKKVSNKKMQRDAPPDRI